MNIKEITLHDAKTMLEKMLRAFQRSKSIFEESFGDTQPDLETLMWIDPKTKWYYSDLNPIHAFTMALSKAEDGSLEDGELNNLVWIINKIESAKFIFTTDSNITLDGQTYFKINY